MTPERKMIASLVASASSRNQDMSVRGCVSAAAAPSKTPVGSRKGTAKVSIAAATGAFSWRSCMDPTPSSFCFRPMRIWYTLVHTMDAAATSRPICVTLASVTVARPMPTLIVSTASFTGSVDCLPYATRSMSIRHGVLRILEIW